MAKVGNFHPNPREGMKGPFVEHPLRRSTKIVNPALRFTIHHFGESEFGGSRLFEKYFGGSKLMNPNLVNPNPSQTGP